MIDTQDRVNDLNSDWIKYVVGSDGQTVRESEMALHAELAMKIVKKHLPGRHDQKSHGKGRDVDKKSSKYAGLNKPVTSRDTSGIRQRGWSQELDEDAADFYSEDIDGLSSHMMKLGKEGVTVSTRELYKDKIVTNLSNDTDLSYDRVNELIATWAQTSNDSDPTSLGLQMAAHEEFGAPLTEWQRSKIDAISTPKSRTISTGDKWIRKTNEEEISAYLSAREDGHKLLRAMYDRTQKELEAAGIDNILLYRGAVHRDVKSFPDKYSEVTMNENALESWSLVYDTASSFSNTSPIGPKDFGAVLQAKVPRERILCSAKTGFGCLTEYEFVVIGSDANDKARVVSVI